MEALGLQVEGEAEILLGNDDEVSVNWYNAVVRWDNRERTIRVLATGSFPFIGARLTYGYHIQYFNIDGGVALAIPLP